ncbi:hypothetical protein KGF56_000130 [Candida oxycetoniae]|uniref:Uncharacterized protein n=1 Tax=Candida oxycetoniae TaxID=497107 RepID=A0AAI9X049_9ASCO|nr:uncharacterized protein KGF56_000130 [Candida oxycetoniae]KAI3407042.2 hypothetical protein KGF56_000130 [Candida oxycetoniae]
MKRKGQDIGQTLDQNNDDQRLQEPKHLATANTTTTTTTTTALSPASQQQFSESLQYKSSSSSLHQIFDDANSINAPKTASTSISANTISMDLVSPSKSLKGFFSKNRSSLYSIDSISEQPELDVHDKISSSSTSQSPRLLNFSLKPKFIRSRSSGLSESSTNVSSAAPPKHSALQPQKKKAQLEDFVDTESYESLNSNDIERAQLGINSNANDTNVDDSINILLGEYDKRDWEIKEGRFAEIESPAVSRPLSVIESEELKAKSNDPLVQEDVEGKLFGFSQPSPTILKRVPLLLNNGTGNIAMSGNRSSSGSSMSSRFRMPSDKIESLKTVGKHLSSSTNVDMNRASFRASITFSDDSENDSGHGKYPDPTITPLHTPRVTQSHNSHINVSSSTDYTQHESIFDTIGTTAGSVPNFQYDNKQNETHPLSSQKQQQSLYTRLEEQQMEEIMEQAMEETMADLNDETGFVKSIATFDDETMLKNDGDQKHESVARSSMSSGELLRNLEGSYNQSRSSTNTDSFNKSQSKIQEEDAIVEDKRKEGEEIPVHYFVLQSNILQPVSAPSGFDELFGTNIKTDGVGVHIPRHGSNPAVNNMTAGLDSTNELPVMTFKVHNKDFDDSKNRWSVYEHRNSQNSNMYVAVGAKLNQTSSYHSLTPPNAELKRPERSYSGGLNSVSNVGIGDSITSRVSNTRSSSPSSFSAESNQSLNQMARNLVNRHFDNTIGESLIEYDQQQYQQSQQDPIYPDDDNSLVLSQPQRNLLYKNKQQPGSMTVLEKQLYTVPIDNSRLPFIPKQQQTNEDDVYRIEYYPMIQFAGLLCLALVIPPIFILITVGVFDGNSKVGYYGGMTSYKEKRPNDLVVLKKFTKAQKVLSLIVGIIWITIVLAMIGVGLGVGLTKK